MGFRQFIFILALCSASAKAALLDLGGITRDTGSGLDWLDVTATQGLSYAEVKQRLLPGGALRGWRYATQAEFSALADQLGVSQLLFDLDGREPDFMQPGESSSPTIGQFLPIDYQMPRASAPLQSVLPIIFDPPIGDPAALPAYDELDGEAAIALLGDTYNAYLDASMAIEDVLLPGKGAVQGIIEDVTLSDGRFGFNFHEHLIVSIEDFELIDRETGQPLSDAFDNYRFYSELPHSYGSFLVRPVPLPPAALLFSGALVFIAGLKRASQRQII